MNLYRLIALVLVALPFVEPVWGYSVLTHEALVDAAWDTALKPALLKRFPGASAQELKEAHAYAYGGAVIQDSGFYPHGSYHFSDFTHYVRTGDFILELLADSKTLDEYAFALGALSHYFGDNIGHRYGTNVAEPLLYPKVARKYGDFLTYTEDPHDHLRTEFGFDVEEVAKANYAPEQYHDFIGFQVAKPVLERAFRQTYGISIDRLYSNLDEAIGSYRYTLATLIPLFTRVAWAAHKGEILKAQPSLSKQAFLYIMSRSSYEREWGRQYNRPSFLDKVLAFFVKILPSWGELSVLKFHALSRPAFQIFMHSFDMAEPDFQKAIHGAAAGTLQLANLNFDTGSLSRGGEYDIQDDAYAYWLDELAQANFTSISPAIRRDILNFYSDLNRPFDTKRNKKNWARLLEQLEELRGGRGIAGMPANCQK